MYNFIAGLLNICAMCAWQALRTTDGLRCLRWHALCVQAGLAAARAHGLQSPELDLLFLDALALLLAAHGFADFLVCIAHELHLRGDVEKLVQVHEALRFLGKEVGNVLALETQHTRSARDEKRFVASPGGRGVLSGQAVLAGHWEQRFPRLCYFLTCMRVSKKNHKKNCSHVFASGSKKNQNLL